MGFESVTISFTIVIKNGSKLQHVQNSGVIDIEKEELLRMSLIPNRYLDRMFLLFIRLCLQIYDH